eukprot:TRINITY_DN7634_c0_g1_i1.p1 TRINITY_DN7634_c0_g1~~TRINITY_DN7634_c0_g1_i1.p1  ORF type:complete len:319 (-),score=47.26 TRINITY_DN7634_c0_g1_i1:438-1286(-)
MAAIVAEGCTVPIDLLKVRLQIQSGRGSSGLGLIPEMFGGIVRREGVRGLFRGIEPALLRHIVYTPIRIVTYEQLRQSIPNDINPAAAVFFRVACGASAGMLAQLIASPFDLLKIRLQADGHRVLAGEARRYTSFLHAARCVWQEGGVAAFWRGWGPNCTRAGLVNMGELATYDIAKQSLIEHRLVPGDGLIAHISASLCSGFVSALVSTPADVCKTRVMNDTTAQYRSMLDCAVKTVQSEGVAALWKGFVPTWARLAPWQLVFWVSYERMRIITSAQSVRA